MEYITERYGQPTSILKLTLEEYKALEPFLKELGVRSRQIIWHNGMTEIQAENPYKTWLYLSRTSSPESEAALRQADKAMSDFAISCYKR